LDVIFLDRKTTCFGR